MGERVEIGAVIASDRSSVEKATSMDRDFAKLVQRELAAGTRTGSGAIDIQPGLSDHEIAGIEGELGVTLPPDFKVWLQAGVPASPWFPEWRDVSGAAFQARMAWPRKSVLQSLEEPALWFASWGARPADTAEAIELARHRIGQSPVLLPVYGHRYLPAGPAAGYPVFSVYGTDVIYYGNDLADYFAAEFGVPRPDWARNDPMGIPFWSELAEDPV